MNLSSVTGKNWKFKKFDSNDVSKFSENFSLTDIVAKLLLLKVTEVVLKNIVPWNAKIIYMP